MTDTTTIADTTQEVTEATQQAVKQVNQLPNICRTVFRGLDYIWTGSAGGTGCFLYRKTGDKVDQEDCEAFI